MKTTYYLLNLLLMSVLLLSCKNNASQQTPNFQNEAHKIVYEMMRKTGDYDMLSKKKDVQYIYTYETPDGKKDISTERYIFDGELSFGRYQPHERTLPELEGAIEQGYNGKEFWLRHKGKYLEDDEALKRVIFNRKTNFYWFAMFQKMADPGLTYEYIKETTIGDHTYDVVKVGFDSDKPSDIYQLYINQKTKLVDQFLFTVVDFDVVETPMLMQVEYEQVEGIQIPSKRRYKKSTWDADVDNSPWITVNWSDIKFNNNLERSLFDKS